jgi:elongation factor G
MDRTGANFDRTVSMIVSRLHGNPIPIQMPYGSGDNFGGIIDLLTMELVTYGDETGTQIERHPIPESHREEAETRRLEMIEKIIESDDLLTEKYLMEEEITDEEIVAALRAGTVTNSIHPVLCGSALKNKGVQMLLDSIVDFLPSPLEVPPVQGISPDDEDEVLTRSANDDDPMSALVFKIVADRFGRLAFTRVYSGVLKTGTRVYNPVKDKVERVGRIVRMFADRREDVDEIHAGDIAAVIGFKDTFTGDTVCEEEAPIVLENIKFPDPVIEVAIEPNSKADQEKLAKGLSALADEDPTFQVEVDSSLGQTKIKGMGELHLEVLVDRMLREFKVGARVGKPRVAYRETITRPVRAEGRFVRQTGGSGQYGHVVVDFEPLPEDSTENFIFENKIVGGTIPREYIPSVQRGMVEAMSGGVLAGYPVTRVKASLVDGSYHEVDSSEIAFKIAGSLALKEGVQRGKPVLLEPTMRVEVVAPDEFTGDIIGDLSARRGSIQGMEQRGDGVSSIKASVPLGEMFGYATNIRNQTQGRGSFTMEFEKYAPTPQTITDEIIKSGKQQ